MSMNTEHLSERGKMLCDLGRFEEAIKVLGQAVMLEPEDAWIRCRLAYAYYQIRAYPEALTHSEAAIHRAPQMEWGHRLRASVLQRWSPPRLNEAMQSALEAVKLEPDSTMALYTVATLQVELKRMEDARATAAHLIEVAPQESDSHDLLAFIELRGGKHAEAEKHARQALQLDPDNNDALRFLASALQGQGSSKAKEAMRTWLEVVRRNPTDKQYQERLLTSATGAIRGRSHGLVVMILIITLFGVNPLLEVLGVGSEARFGVAIVIVGLMAFGVLIWRRRAVQELPAQVRQLLGIEARTRRRLSALSTLANVLLGVVVALGLLEFMLLILTFSYVFIDNKDLEPPMLLMLVPPMVMYGLWRARRVVLVQRKRIQKPPV
jgi:tetratricopeptide (TPR) repeat protein